MRDKVVEKQKKVLLLEEQIRSIAYGTQKPIPLKAVEAKNELSTDLSIMFTSISLTDEFIATAGVCPAYFLSLEFFDFELQTTPILTNQTNTLDFTTIYSVVVSNLFVHYIETNGITIEMYSPQNTAYTLLAAGVVTLKPLLQEITFFLFENRVGSNEEKDGVLSMLSLPLAPLRENKPIKGSFEMVKGKPPEPRPAMPSQISVDNIRSASSSLEDDDYSPVSVVSPKIPSVAESIEREGAVSEREEIETVSVKNASARSSASANGTAEEEVHEGDEKASPSSSSTPSQVDPMDTPRPTTNESGQIDKNEAEDVSPAQMKRMEKEKARDEIRSLLGDLPPIAKPRLTKAPSEFSSFPLFRDQAKQESQRSNSSTESAKSDDTTVERHRSVVFTDPLHRSIPPSEASSASSPPPKPAVRLPVSGGRSAIRTRQENRQEE
ncbi:hypothetical protein TELCIR_11075, partial [Teladorsagia circumcincta]